jgi:hypothetical protein
MIFPVLAKKAGKTLSSAGLSVKVQRKLQPSCNRHPKPTNCGAAPILTILGIVAFACECVPQGIVRFACFSGSIFNVFDNPPDGAREGYESQNTRTSAGHGWVFSGMRAFIETLDKRNIRHEDKVRRTCKTVVT